MSKHTPEPWKTFGDNGYAIGIYTCGSDCPVIAAVRYSDNPALPHGVGIANADRIVACVNALKGIPNKALDEGVVQELVAALRVMVDDYKQTADSGDCGFYKAEEQPEYIRACAVLAKLNGGE